LDESRRHVGCAAGGVGDNEANGLVRVSRLLRVHSDRPDCESNDGCNSETKKLHNKTPFECEKTVYTDLPE
jgi:hypothetical protein